MPTGLTGRSRTITTSATAAARQIHTMGSVVVPGSGNTQWGSVDAGVDAVPCWWGNYAFDGSSSFVAALGTYSFGAYVDNHDGTLSWTLTPGYQLTVQPYKAVAYTGTAPFTVTFPNTQWAMADWDCTAAATITEVVSLVEDQVSEGTWREHRYLTSISVSYTISGTITVHFMTPQAAGGTPSGGFGTIASSTAYPFSFSGTISLTDSTSDQGAGHDYARPDLSLDYLACVLCGVNAAGASIFDGGNASLDSVLYGLAAGLSTSGAVGVSGTGLTYPTSSASLSASGRTLFGNLAGLTYTITDASLDAGADHLDFDGFAFNGGYYSAQPHVEFQAAQADRDYNGAGISPTMDRVGGGASGTGTTYTPADVWYAALAEAGHAGSGIHSGAGSYSDQWNVGTFQYDEGWADGYGVLLDSSNFPDYPANLARFVISSPFDAGTIQFQDSYQFACFRTLGEWSVAGGAATLSAGSGSTLKAHVTGAATLSRSTLFKPYAHRYAQVRVKGPVGKQFSLVLGTRTGSGALTYYRWVFTIQADQTWEIHTFDLAAPQQSGGLVAWAGVSGLVHNYQTLPPWMTGGGPYGRSMLLLADPGDWEWDYVEGYYRTDGTRTPVLVIGPMEASGALSAAFDETQGQVVGSPPILYLAGVANGSKLWELVQPSGSVATAWNSYASLLNGDTGLVVTAAAGLATSEASLRSSIPTQPGYQEPGAGGTASYQAEVTIAGFPSAYYGAGDPVGGSYGSTIQFTALRGWNGERIGNLVSGGASLPGATVELRDDDSGTLVASSTSDDDGLYRLPAHYGAIDVYSNTPRGGSSGSRYQGSDDSTYTALGKQLNAWWVKGDTSGTAPALSPPVDGSGYLLASPGGSRKQLTIFDRYGWWQDLAVYPVGLWPGLLGHPRSPHFLKATAEAGGIVVRRAAAPFPPFEATIQITPPGTGDARPCLGREHATQRVWCHWERGGNTYGAYSDNEGDDWSMAALVITGGRYPKDLSDELTGAFAVAAVVSGTGGFNIAAQWQDAGGAPGSLLTWVDNATGLPIVVADDGFDWDVASEGPRRLRATLHVAGEADTSEWWSAPPGQYWNRVS